VAVVAVVLVAAVVWLTLWVEATDEARLAEEALLTEPMLMGELLGVAGRPRRYRIRETQQVSAGSGAWRSVVGWSERHPPVPTCRTMSYLTLHVAHPPRGLTTTTRVHDTAL
jgi:hypothetical protein